MDKFDETIELKEDTQALEVVKKEKGIVKKMKDAFIGSWLEAPGFIRDNEYIKGGYRINFNSAKKIFRSLFMVHNESMNIWSHLLGVILFITFVVYIAVYITPKITLPDFKNQLRTKYNWTSLYPDTNQFSLP